MIAVHLLEHATQVVIAKKKKDKLFIEDGFYLRGIYLDDFLHCDISQMTEMFRELGESCHNVRSEQVYIVLPDSAFVHINCFDYTDNINDYREVISNLDECYYAKPIELKRTTKHKETVCFIKKELINVLCQAAELQKIKLYAIEAASFAVLRAAGRWKSEVMILSASRTGAYISSYSILAGMYTTILPNDLSRQNVINAPETVSEQLQQIFITAEYVNKATFGNNNPNVATYVISDGSEITNLEVLKERKAAIQIPECIKNISAQEFSEYMAAVGSLMQVFSIETGSAALILHPANVMPQERLLNNKHEHFKAMLKKVCLYSSVTAALVCAIEICAIVYFSMVSIPESLEESYTEAQAKMPELQVLSARLQQCREEDEHIPEAIYALVSTKPAELGFTELAIGTKGAASRDAAKANKEADKKKAKKENQKKKTEKWITFEAKTTNPLVIQDYVNTLNQYEIFESVITEEIASESKKDNMFKSAKVYILKGDVQ